jgi:hypothetical protein
VLSYHNRSSSSAKKTRKIGQRMRVMHVNDIGPFPCGGDISRRDLLRAESRKRKCPSDLGSWPDRLAARSAAFHCHHLDLVPQIGGAFDQCLNDALHATRSRPVVFGEVEYAHAPRSPWVGERGPTIYIPMWCGNFTGTPIAVNLTFHARYHS